MNGTGRVVHIPSEAQSWPVSRNWANLDDLCDGVFDCPHTTPILTDVGPYVVRSQDIRSGVFRRDEAARVSEETYVERIARAEPKYGDILYSREGTYFGIAAIVPECTRVCLGQRMVLIRPNRNLLDSRFLLYWLNSPLMARHLHGFRDGSVAERLNMPTIRGLPVPKLDINLQGAIGQVLGTLDDKIDLSRRMNETLEAMARAIFKDWFVDFGPVRAKAEGRQPPGLSPDIAALFPDALDDDDKPVGWEIGRLGDVLYQRVERVHVSEETASLPYVPIECISSHSLALTDSKPGEEAQSSLTRFYKYDILFGAMRPYFHKVCIAPFSGTTRTTVFVLKNIKEYDFSFACAHINNNSTVDYATCHSNGSTIPYAIWKDSLELMQIVLPPARVRKAFDDIVRPILLKLPETYFENKSLSAIRDLLLPKLMSGEIRLKDAEKAMEVVR